MCATPTSPLPTVKRLTSSASSALPKRSTSKTLPSGASYATARATTLSSRAWVTSHRRGQVDEAEGYYRESLAIAVESDDASEWLTPGTPLMSS